MKFGWAYEIIYVYLIKGIFRPLLTGMYMEAINYN